MVLKKMALGAAVAGLLTTGSASLAQAVPQNTSGAPVPQGASPLPMPPANVVTPGSMPGAMPPGAMPPRGMPPGAMAPGSMPPGVMPPGTMPPGAMPPGTPGAMSSGTVPLMPPTGMPGSTQTVIPGATPGAPGAIPGAMPPNVMPPGSAMAMPPQQPGGATARPSASFGIGPDQIEGWLTFVKDQLKVTDAQAPQWSAFAEVMRSNSRKFSESRGGQGSASIPLAATTVERLQQMEELATLQLELVRATKGALPPFYRVLTDDQKKAADNYIRGPLGML